MIVVDDDGIVAVVVVVVVGDVAVFDVLDLHVIRRCVRVRIYLLSGRIPAKAMKHLKSHLVTRYLIRNKKQETRRSK